MNIRFAEKTDLPQLVELCKQHAHYEQADYDITGKEELLDKAIFGESAVLKCLVVSREDSIIGYTTYLKQFSTWDAAYYVYLDCLFLSEEIRGKGLGTTLIEKVKEYAKAEKCNIIQWQTPTFNIQAIKFYQKIGGVSKTKERFSLVV